MVSVLGGLGRTLGPFARVDDDFWKCIHPTPFIQCCIVEVGCTCCPQS